MQTQLSLWFVLLLICGFPIVLVLMFKGIALIVSHVGDWSRLAKHYRSEKDFSHAEGMTVSGRVGIVGYGGTLDVHWDQEGLYLSITFLKTGHPNLFMPWSDIRWSEHRFLWIKMIHLEMGQPKKGTLDLPFDLEPVFKQFCARSSAG